MKNCHMVAITKEEKEVIRDNFPKVHIVRTMKRKSKRHKYFVEESRSVMRLLNELRSKIKSKVGVPSRE